MRRTDAIVKDEQRNMRVPVSNIVSRLEKWNICLHFSPKHIVFKSVQFSEDINSRDLGVCLWFEEAGSPQPMQSTFSRGETHFTVALQRVDRTATCNKSSLLVHRCNLDGLMVISVYQ